MNQMIVTMFYHHVNHQSVISIILNVELIKSVRMRPSSITQKNQIILQQFPLSRRLQVQQELLIVLQHQLVIIVNLQWS
jgi:hypothetical protein